jgi:hypothetical protein
MKEIIIDGIPVLIKERERPPRTIRIKLMPRKIKDLPFSRLSDRHKQALTNLVVMGIDKKKEAGLAAGFSESSVGKVMDKLLARRQIFKKLEELCQALYGMRVDEKVAEVLVEQLEAVHPLAKRERTDNLAVISAAKEINKLSDNYPSKKIDIREVGLYVHYPQDDGTAAKKYGELTADEES